MLYRFADGAALEAWEQSSERDWWLGSSRGLMTQTRAERRTGIEGWFDDPESLDVVVKQPPRWKQAVVIYTAFFPLSLLSAVLLLPHLEGLPRRAARPRLDADPHAGHDVPGAASGHPCARVVAARPPGPLAMPHLLG